MQQLQLPQFYLRLQIKLTGEPCTVLSTTRQQQLQQLEDNLITARELLAEKQLPFSIDTLSNARQWWEIFAEFALIKPSGSFRVNIDGALTSDILRVYNHYCKVRYTGAKFEWTAVTDGSDKYNYVLKYGISNDTQTANRWVKQLTTLSDLYCYDDSTRNELVEDVEGISLETIADNTARGLSLLKVGGGCIFKLSTFFLPASWQLLTSWQTRFRETYLYKPSISSLSTSDIYFIGLNYLGPTTSNIIGNDMGNDLYKATDLLFGSQVQYINQLNNIGPDKSILRRTNEIAAAEWQREYAFEPLDPKDEL
jgi:hypothetical protein